MNPANEKTYKDSYTKIEEINSGGQGSTFLATDNNTNNKIVIKLLKSQKDEERRARMYREYIILKTLQNENIPKAINSNANYYLDKSYKLYIAMEYIEGDTLSEFIDKGHFLTLNEKINFIKTLLSTIMYCHNNGVIHRDLKPDNIILKNNDIRNPYLIDFGLSFNSKEPNNKITPDEQILGNRFLFLPELGKNSENKNDIRTDITMIIGLLFYLTTNKEPGHLINENNKLPHQKKIETLMPEQYEDLNKLSYVFDIGFQPNINHRFQNIDTLITELDFVLKPQKRNSDILNELKEFNKKRMTESFKSKLIDEKIINEITNIIDKSFFLFVRETNNSVRLIRIKCSSGWCAYSIVDKIKRENNISIKIEVQMSGDYLFISGGECELHGVYTNGTERITRINKNDKFDKIQIELLKFISNKVIDKYK